MTATERDIHNTEAWAAVVGDVLWHVPIELRKDVLRLALEQVEAELRAGTGLQVFEPDDLEQSPGLRHWNAIMRLKALLVQVFARNITNNHSAERAAELLFTEQKFGTGSASLLDYIGDLVDLHARRRA
jgi:hypothetical protein